MGADEGIEVCESKRKQSDVRARERAAGTRARANENERAKRGLEREQERQGDSGDMPANGI